MRWAVAGVARLQNWCTGILVQLLPLACLGRCVPPSGNALTCPCPCSPDLLNVHITLLMLGWQSVPRQVVVLDAHRRASLDLMWPVVAAGAP